MRKFQKAARLRAIPNNVCAPRGFLASGIAAGIKKSGGKDVAMIISETPCLSAGTFTTNSAKAAPVLFDLAHVRRQAIRGIIINSGNANACTGKHGLRNAQAMSTLAGQAVTALGFPAGKHGFLVCSTGRIGIQLPMEKISRGIRKAAAHLARKGQIAAEAIMTTDTFPKEVAVEIKIGSATVRVGGIAKGAGMIQPGMSTSGRRPALHATMLSFVTTDAAISPATLQECLNRAVAQSFNRITVDGDMSTNDTVLLLANGKAGNKTLRRASPDLRLFQEALNHVTLTLAQMIVKDGEGTSKVVTVKITGASSANDAELAVRAIGNSTLVKCSWCGEDPNWGRLYDAIGYSGARFNDSVFSIKYDGILLVRNGLQIQKNWKKVCQIVKKPSFLIECGLGLGNYQSILYTTDLTEKYVELNKGE